MHVQDYCTLCIIQVSLPVHGHSPTLEESVQKEEAPVEQETVVKVGVCVL